MKKRQAGMWIIGGLMLLLVAFAAMPFIATATRSKQESFKIQKVYEQTANVVKAFNVSGMTRDFVVSEGPCNDTGCNGGIMSQQLPVDVEDLIPYLKNYDAASTTIIWLYQVRPSKVTRHNDLFGEDTVTITGTLTKGQNIYFAVVPAQIVEPNLHLVYVEIK